MAEYYQLEDTIVKQLELPVVRGFLFGDIDENQTFNKALPLLLACYRQRQIKLMLQGRENLAGKETSDIDRIKVIREFLDGELDHTSK